MNSKIFQPELRPIRIKTNINKITQYVAKCVTGLGYNVYVSYSNKSRSRYLEIVLSKEEKVIVRISDHVADKKKRWRFKFDIHTTERRRRSVDYIEFLDAFMQIVDYIEFLDAFMQIVENKRETMEVGL